MDSRYEKRREKMNSHFTEDKLVGETWESKQGIASPSGKYRLKIFEYTQGKGYWDFTRGMVYCGDELIFDIKRNYGEFWFCWAQHPSGNEYLLCGEDYQGYSVLNLTQRQEHKFFPEAGYGMGLGFCWARAEFDPETCEVEACGCIWGGPFDLVRYDFTNPDVLPLVEKSRRPEDPDDEVDEDEDEAK